MIRPPCGRSRDQNFGHVTKQAAAGRRWQPAPRDRTKVMPPVGKDKIKTQRGSSTYDPNAQLRIHTPVTAVSRGHVLPRTVRIPSDWFFQDETKRCGRPLLLVEKRNFASGAPPNQPRLFCLPATAVAGSDERGQLVQLPSLASHKREVWPSRRSCIK